MMRFVALLLLLSSTAFASVDIEALNDPVLDQRARAVTRTLRCLVCQNESIEDSDAPLAHDLRDLVRQRIKAGDSDDEVRAYIVARYGDWVLLKPPFNARMAAVWLAPGVILVLGALAMAALWRRRREVSGLSPEEEARVAKLLNDVNV